MPIKVLKIENFKSIKSLTLDCKRINLFIGEPNTGKSNILEAIGTLSHAGHGLHINRFVRFEAMTDLFYDRILEEPIKICFDEETLQINFKNGYFNGTYNNKARTERVFSYSYAGDTTGVWSDFIKFKFYRFAKKHNFPRQDSEFLLPPDGENLLAIIVTRKELRNIVNEIFGKFGYRPVFKPQEGQIEFFKELEGIIFSFPYSLASETLQRVVFYLAAIHSNKDSILAFEEPEAHAFPYYTKYLAEIIALDKNNNQYFISTHNPYFLTSILEKAPKQEVAVFVTTFQQYQTKAKPLTEKQKQKILADMGYDFFFNIEKFLD
jgi:AAA15 family ATPase/GTPase